MKTLTKLLFYAQNIQRTVGSKHQKFMLRETKDCLAAKIREAPTSNEDKRGQVHKMNRHA